ncbi:MAG: class I SAM-dependent methyltransferase [Eubacteriales bacterium]
MNEFMGTVQKMNTDRFDGFADIYDEARPRCPVFVTELAKKYLERTPETVVDLGSGTGRSALVWKDEAKYVVGVEPNSDMIERARANAKDDVNVGFVRRFSNDTGLPASFADVVTCSQAFHWMEPIGTLREVNRILRPEGMLMIIDADLTPVCNWKAEYIFRKFAKTLKDIETTDPDISATFVRWNRDKHLGSLAQSGYFIFIREIVFSNKEMFTAERLIRMVLSLGGLQTILKRKPDSIAGSLEEFEQGIREIFGEQPFEAQFGYRVTVGMKSTLWRTGRHET